MPMNFFRHLHQKNHRAATIVDKGGLFLLNGMKISSGTTIEATTIIAPPTTTTNTAHEPDPHKHKNGNRYQFWLGNILQITVEPPPPKTPASPPPTSPKTRNLPIFFLADRPELNVKTQKIGERNSPTSLPPGPLPPPKNGPPQKPIYPSRQRKQTQENPGSFQGSKTNPTP